MQFNARKINRRPSGRASTNPVQTSFVDPATTQLMNITVRFSWTILLVLLVSTGCDPDFRKPNQIAAVEGEVTLDGDPVSDAHVVFIPLNVRQGKTEVPFAFGTTDAKGKFELAMSNGKTGAFVGSYSVVISKTSSSSYAATDNSPEPQRANQRLTAQEKLKQNEIQRLKTQRVEKDLSYLRARPPMDRFFNATQDPNELIPSLYNRYSVLTREVKSIGGLSEPIFDLRSVDPLLTEPAED